MKKVINIFMLPLLLFTGCDLLDDLEKCANDYDAWKASSDRFRFSPTQATCEEFAKDLLPLIENDCALQLDGTGYEDWTVADVDSLRLTCSTFGN